MPQTPQMTPATKANLVATFLDTTIPSFATSEHTAKSLESNTFLIHQEVYHFLRDTYLQFLNLKELPHNSQQMALRLLFSQQGEDQEELIIVQLLKQLPSQERFKMLSKLSEPFHDLPKINNARVRRIVLNYLFTHEQLAWWSIKYRNKLRKTLTHLWGVRKTSILGSILAKSSGKHDAKEKHILNDLIDRYSNDLAYVYECVAFVLNADREWRIQEFTAFEQAKKNLDAGDCLPANVLEGLRSTYHKHIPSTHVVALTKASQTRRQLPEYQTTSQQRTELFFNPQDFDPISLYLFAFEMGLHERVKEVLEEKAKHMARSLPFPLDNIGILIDASEKMKEHPNKALIPMATALSLRDVLQAASKHAIIQYAGGQQSDEFVMPEGANLLEHELKDLQEKHPNLDAIFVMSNAYDQANPYLKITDAPLIMLNPNDFDDEFWNEGPDFGTNHIFKLALIRAKLEKDPEAAFQHIRDLTTEEE